MTGKDKDRWTLESLRPGKVHKQHGYVIVERGPDFVGTVEVVRASVADRLREERDRLKGVEKALRDRLAEVEAANKAIKGGVFWQALEAKYEAAEERIRTLEGVLTDVMVPLGASRATRGTRLARDAFDAARAALSTPQEDR